MTSIPKYGICALAYSTADVASALSCYLIIKPPKPSAQTLISLQSSIRIHGFHNEQPFTLLYRADNLVSGTTSSTHATALPPRDLLEKIQRSSSPDLKTLSLTITNPCDILCPISSRSIAPKDRGDPAYSQFVKLAKATEINILFDFKWIHTNRHSDFNDLLAKLKATTSRKQRIINWTAFIPIEDAVSEHPPLYTQASNKRRVGTSLTSESPPLKRQRHSFAPLPTEEATTASTPSSKTPSSPIANEPDYQDAIENAVQRLLPKALKTILDMLLHLPADPTSSPSPSTLSLSLSSLSPLKSAPIPNYIKDQIQEIYEKTLDDAEYLRSVADMKFQEDLDDTRLEFQSIKEDAMDELTRFSDDLLHQMKESAAEIVEDVEEDVSEHARNVYDGIRERLDGLVESSGACFKKKPGIAQETVRCQRATSWPC